MKKKTLLIAGAVCTAPLLLAGIGLATDGAPPAGAARTEVVVRRDLFSTVTGSGMVQPRNKVDVSSDMSGRVLLVAVQEGQYVEKGALLLQIDDSRQQSSVLRAQAAVEQAQASAEQVRANLRQVQSVLARSEQLAGTRGWVTPAELDQARSQVAVVQAQLRSGEFAVQQARASLAESRDALAKCTLYAPASGLVTRLNIQAGETAVVGSSSNPGSLLLTIADPSVMEARIRVDETDVPSIQVGDRATVRIDAFPRQSFPGRVVRVSNSASRGNGATSAHFQVVIALDSTAVPLHPELSANADVVTEERRQVLAIPILALTARDRAGHRPDAAGGAADGGPTVEGVFVVRDGVARWTPVRVGIVGKTFFEVASGLQGGETVVSGSYPLVRSLEDGDEVEVAPARPAAAPAGR
jgi:HlyD family secretion protein